MVLAGVSPFACAAGVRLVIFSTWRKNEGRGGPRRRRDYSTAVSSDKATWAAALTQLAIMFGDRFGVE